MNEITILKGDLIVDDRGDVRFVNDFDFSNVKRFYIVKNHTSQFIRAWHGHKKEGKYVSVVKGVALVCSVKIDNWENPSRNLPINRIVLSEHKPTVMYIPPGHANGFMSLTNDTTLIFYSTSKLQDSLNDDFRYDSKYWNPWNIEER